MACRALTGSDALPPNTPITDSLALETTERPPSPLRFFCAVKNSVGVHPMPGASIHCTGGRGAGLRCDTSHWSDPRVDPPPGVRVAAVNVGVRKPLLGSSGRKLSSLS